MFAHRHLRRFSRLVRCTIVQRDSSTNSSKGNDGNSTFVATTLFIGALGLDFVNNFRLSKEAYRNLVDNVAMPLIRLLDAETAHNISIKATALGFAPKDSNPDEPILRTNLLGLNFPNAVGLAAGYDKNAEAIDGLFGLGFGFVEIGTVTPEPQGGNEKPRMFRLKEDKGIINRCGFNNDGAEIVAKRLKKFSEKPRSKEKLLGVNVGKNKWVSEADASDDYCNAIHKLAMYGNYIVINISSPNTPGLRLLQRREVMASLINKCIIARDEVASKTGKKLPLLVKIAPDLNKQELTDVSIVAFESGIDGLIISNTTISRPGSLQSALKSEIGGLSGAPLRDISTQAIYDMYEITAGKIPLIGVGGVGTGQHAYEKICAGASLVQVYSMLVYNGPGSVQTIKKELTELLKANGFNSVSEAVGSAHRRNKSTKNS